MLKRTLKILLFVPLAFLAACAGQGSSTTSTGVTPAKPLIDTRAPIEFETATFALG